SAVHRAQTADCLDQRRLARTGLAHQHRVPAGWNRKGDIAEAKSPSVYMEVLDADHPMRSRTTRVEAAGKRPYNSPDEDHDTKRRRTTQTRALGRRGRTVRMEARMKMLLLMLGGALGTYLRYGVGKWFDDQAWAEGFPFGTLFINVTGSFVLAVTALLILE